MKYFVLTFTAIFTLLANVKPQYNDEKFISHIVNPSESKFRFFWKDDTNKNFANFQNLKDWLAEKGDTLVFAMNGGMYLPDLSPQGLYIENGKVLSEIDTLKNGYGNFYMKPNGIFYLQSDFTPAICKTEDFPKNTNILYATQSGPLLLIDGKVHPKFREGSASVHIRNGVGILPNGNILFAMSKNKINFYDFASYFKAKGCKYALYLDGFVSRAYLPAKNWVQLDGTFGVIMGQIK